MSAHVIVYTKIPCPFCDRAKNLLKNKGIPFEEKLLKTTDEMLALKQKTGWMTFPQIFIDGKLIGGFDDMAALDRSGQLDLLVKKPR